MIFYNNNIIIGVHNIIIMGANGLVVGDRFPSHSRRLHHTAPHVYQSHEIPVQLPADPHVMGTQSHFFSPIVSVYQTISSSLSLSGRPSFSGRRRVLISLITIYGTENNDTRRRRLLHTRSWTTNSSGGVCGASWCRARALLFITRLRSVGTMCVRVHNNNIIYYYVR